MQTFLLSLVLPFQPPLLRRSEVIGGEASYLGKLTSYQSGLTPRKETRLFLTKNHNGITKFGNTVGSMMQIVLLLLCIFPCLFGVHNV